VTSPAAVTRLSLCPDVLFLVDGRGDWIASNPLARIHVAVSPSAAELLRRLRAPGELSAALAGLEGLWAEDRTVFGPRRCALDDATGISHEPGRRLAGAEAVALLRERFVLLEDLAAYRERFGPKRRPMDPDRFGNFHQQIGQELLLRQRVKPDDWWVSQKFEDDLSGVKNTAYRKVQHEFLEREVPGWGLAGKRVLDVGCGVGYFAEFFRRVGGAAEVLGLDPNADYIRRAQATFRAPGLRFETFDFAKLESLTAHRGAGFDLIYLSDVLLFYFVSYKNKPEELAGAVGFLSALKSLLAPGGRIMVMDPHGSFSLCGRYGDPAQPLAVLGEYKRRVWGIASTLEPLGRAVRAAGLAVTGIWEPCYEGPVRDAEDAFLKEFPVWWVFELRALP